MSPLCSRNARSQKTLVDARSEGLIRVILRTRYTSKLGMFIFGRSLRPCLGQGASLGEEAVLADSGRVGIVAAGVGRVRRTAFLSILYGVLLLPKTRGPMKVWRAN